MELLIYGNRKSENMIWDISTPEKRAQSFLALFAHLRDDWEVYECEPPTGKARELLLEANTATRLGRCRLVPKVRWPDARRHAGRFDPQEFFNE